MDISPLPVRRKGWPNTELRHSKSRSGYAMLLVMIFISLLLSVASVCFRDIASALRTEQAMQQLEWRDEGVVRAVSEAAPMDRRLEKAWTSFLNDFDNAVANRIEQQQAAGLIKPFPALPVAIALNRMDAGLVIHHFGRRPRGNPKTVLDAMVQVWSSTLYGIEVSERVGAEMQRYTRSHKSAES